MKSIIIISTIMFVTASFMGIGNYMRYNDILSQKGLYKTSSEQTTLAETVPENAETQQPQRRVEDIVVENQLEEIEQVVPHAKKSGKIERNAHQVSARQKTVKKETKDVVLHSARTPVARDINIKRFSRAPLRDDFEPAPIVDNESLESVAAPTINEENE